VALDLPIGRDWGFNFCHFPIADPMKILRHNRLSARTRR
jgi:hypothetical protein